MYRWFLGLISGVRWNRPGGQGLRVLGFGCFLVLSSAFRVILGVAGICGSGLRVDVFFNLNRKIFQVRLGVAESVVAVRLSLLAGISTEAGLYYL